MSALGMEYHPGAPGTGAAPAGGPITWGRGCALSLILASTPLAASEPEFLSVPSGQPVWFHDMIWDEPGRGLTFRFRFVAPEIVRDDTDFVLIAGDMDYLCSDYALPRVADPAPTPNRIIITLMSEPVEFGVMTPDVTQFFESYSLENGLCIWEAF